MATLFLEGFDKYGGPNNNLATVAALMAGEWTTITSATITTGLSSSGQAANLSNGASLNKTLATNYGRIIGGLRFSTPLTGTVGINFIDSTTAQCSISIPTTGLVTLRAGAYNGSGTLLGTASSPIATNTTHYLEWDLTIGASAAFQVWLDGTSVISGTGNTHITTNSSISAIALLSVAGISNWTVDDLYLFDNTGTNNNATLLTSPRIETAFPIADNSVQFSVGASILGPSTTRNSLFYSTSANLFYLRPFGVPAALTLNSISLMPNATNGTVNLRPVVYADNGSGSPGTILGFGLSVLGIAAGTPLSMPLSTPINLTAGLIVWLGFMIDTAISSAFLQADTLNLGRTATATFTTGAPSTPPTTTSGAGTVLLWGNVTLNTPNNTYELIFSPPPYADTSYVYANVVGDEDLYNFTNSTATTVYTTAVKALGDKTDSGTRTVSMHLNSNGTDGAGASVSPGTSYSWLNAYYDLDPNGNIAWTPASLSAATAGFRVDS